MKVLLIGKFPPCQGGISSKTFWLCRELASRDINFDIVTIVPALYRSETTGELPSNVRLRQLTTDEEPPWFIPGGELWLERLVSTALDFADDQLPDVVEANYLAPYGFAAFSVSRILDVPLLIRHSGSDLAKLRNWDPARRALESLMINADFIATTPDAVLQLPKQAGSSNSLVPLPRYAPDPRAFQYAGDTSAYCSLRIAGKINYFWKLKALDTLIAALKLRQGWKLEMIADGKGLGSFEAEIKKHGISERVHRQAFIPPDQMPAFLSEATAVWAVERQGEIIDFSNIVWEALSVGSPCLVSEATNEHPDIARFRDSPLLLVVNPEDPLTIAEALDKAASMNVVGRPAGLTEAYNKYFEATVSLYQQAARSGRES